MRPKWAISRRRPPKSRGTLERHRLWTSAFSAPAAAREGSRAKTALLTALDIAARHRGDAVDVSTPANDPHAGCNRSKADRRLNRASAVNGWFPKMQLNVPQGGSTTPAVYLAGEPNGVTEYNRLNRICASDRVSYADRSTTVCIA